MIRCSRFRPAFSAGQALQVSISVYTAYTYVGDDPVNESDPSGQCWPRWACPVENAVAQAVSYNVHLADEALPVVHEIANIVTIGASLCAVVTSETIIGGATCGAIAAISGGVTAASGLALYAEGRESGSNAAIDAASAGFGGIGSLLEAGARTASLLAEDAQLTSLLRTIELEVAPWYGKLGLYFSSQYWAAKAALWGGAETLLSDLARVVSASGFGLGLYGEIVTTCQ